MGRTLPVLLLMVAGLAGCIDLGETGGSTPGAGDEMTELTVKSAFAPFAQIPIRYTCDGDDFIPPFEITGIPPRTKSIAVIVEDPDAPRGLFVHWVAWNLPPSGKYPESVDVASLGGKEGINSANRYGYMGPCPPPGPAHRYFFKFYALDTMLDLDTGTKREGLLNAMKGHVLAQGEIVGKYGRH
ncbi:MAG: YbhB/YbcL family Raf kinase inhibitor-like protein [Candidatus Micrarchaeia archaeon]